MKLLQVMTATLTLTGGAALNTFAQIKKSLPQLSLPNNNGPPPSKVQTESWLDVLQYPNNPPNFDVLSKTKEFAACKLAEERNAFLAADYVFEDAYPNLELRPFGFTIDPDNPYRCYWFERWEGTHTNYLQVGRIRLPPTNKDVKLPTHIMSAHWTPEGKIKYTCLSSPLDRWEGTTKGAGAIFGLLVNGGVNAGENASVGNWSFRLQQRFVHLIGGFGRSWSLEEDIPSWWKSRARGADPNDL